MTPFTLVNDSIYSSKIFCLLVNVLFTSKWFRLLVNGGLVDREDERKGQASKASCWIPAATLKANLKALAPSGAGLVSSLLYRSDYQGSLKGHYDHSLLSGTVFLVLSYLVVTKPPRGLRKSWSTLVYG